MSGSFNANETFCPIQITPARAKKKFDSVEDAMKMATILDWEQKIDGERFKLHTSHQGHVYDSRRESSVDGLFVRKEDRIPHIARHYLNLPSQSIFDGEVVSLADEKLVELPSHIWDKLAQPDHPHMIWFKEQYYPCIPVYPHVSETTSIMGSLAARAIQLQQQNNSYIRHYVFDLLQYANQDPSRNSQRQRRDFLATILAETAPINDGPVPGSLLLMPQWRGLTPKQIEEFYYLITDPPIFGEGLIGKDPYAPYNAAKNWWKLKKEYPVDVVTTGEYKIGDFGKTGLMYDKVSSVGIGVYHNGALYPVGWMSSIADGHHNIDQFTRWAADGVLAHRTLTVKHNGIQEDPTSPIQISLRHPRFNRWREDKNATDCTLTALLAEVAKSKQ